MKKYIQLNQENIKYIIKNYVLNLTYKYYMKYKGLVKALLEREVKKTNKKLI